MGRSCFFFSLCLPWSSLSNNIRVWSALVCTLYCTALYFGVVLYCIAQVAGSGFGINVNVSGRLVGFTSFSSHLRHMCTSGLNLISFPTNRDRLKIMHKKRWKVEKRRRREARACEFLSENSENIPSKLHKEQAAKWSVSWACRGVCTLTIHMHEISRYSKV